MSQEEVGEAMQQLYGDTTARTALLAQSASQLQAEAAVATTHARRAASSSRPSVSPGPSPVPNYHSAPAATQSAPIPTFQRSGAGVGIVPCAPPEVTPASPAGTDTAVGSSLASLGAAMYSSRRIVPEAMGAPAAGAPFLDPPSSRAAGPGTTVGAKAVSVGLQGRMGPPPPVPVPAIPSRTSQPVREVTGGKRPANGSADAGRAAKRVMPERVGFPAAATRASGPSHPTESRQHAPGSVPGGLPAGTA